MRKYFLLILILPVLFACTDHYINSPYPDDGFSNGSTPSSGKLKVFPNEFYSYWIYDTFILDSNDSIIQNSQSKDSVVVIGEILKSGYMSRIFSTFTGNFGIYNHEKDNYYAVEGSKLLTTQSYLSVFLEGAPFNFINFSDEEWITLVDTEDELWRIMRVKFEDQNIPDIPFVTITGKVDILDSWEGKRIININGNSINSDEYLMTFDFIANITIPLYGSISISIQRELYQHYAENIGLVHEKLNSSGISLPLIGSINLPGFERTLSNYSIK
jgi:hypothetical protein